MRVPSRYPLGRTGPVCRSLRLFQRACEPLPPCRRAVAFQPFYGIFLAEGRHQAPSDLRICNFPPDDSSGPLQLRHQDTEIIAELGFQPIAHGGCQVRGCAARAHGDGELTASKHRRDGEVASLGIIGHTAQATRLPSVGSDPRVELSVIGAREHQPGRADQFRRVRLLMPLDAVCMLQFRDKVRADHADLRSRPRQPGHFARSHRSAAHYQHVAAGQIQLDRIQEAVTHAELW